MARDGSEPWRAACGVPEHACARPRSWGLAWVPAIPGSLRLRCGGRSLVEGQLADPVEAPAHQQELRRVELAQLDRERVLEQGTLQDEVVPVGEAVGERSLLRVPG